MRTLLNIDCGNIKALYLFQDYTLNSNIYTARLCRERGILILRYIPPKRNFPIFNSKRCTTSIDNECISPS